MEKPTSLEARSQLIELKNHNPIIALTSTDTLENTQSVLAVVSELMLQSTQTPITWPANISLGIHSILSCTINALEFEIENLDKKGM